MTGRNRDAVKGGAHDTGRSPRTAPDEGSGPAGTRSPESDAHDAALEVRRVAVQLGGAAVLDDVSLTARAGEIVALLGPSGCGKTTLLRVIAGLQPHAGDVLWQGHSLAAVPAHRRGFGLVFQDQALFPHLDVERNVAFGLRMQPRTRRGGAAERVRRVVELLELVGLSGLSRRPVDALSGGEAQRVALARALAPHPRLLMLDEPLSGLDRPLREQLLVDLPRILRRLRQTALFVTHDLEEALAVSDRVAVMRAGRIVQVGTPRALYERPASVFVARFLGRANILPGKIVTAGSLRGGGPQRLIETEIGPLPYDMPAADGERGAVLIRPERISLADTNLGQRSSGRATTPGPRERYTLLGTLQDTSFRGIAAFATVAVRSTSLQVLVPVGRTLPAVGAAVTVSFDPLAAVFPLAETV
ncbi:MAG: ABC transporter ATP-binding protein [Spirochaetaceae bacterium]|nr:ABC transporter ATP-binding protein [Spirochaetaceae bacterium]